MTRSTKVVLAVFVATQVLDGVLTYAGITRGVAHEANPLIAGLIPYTGLFVSLGAMKLFAVGCGCVLAILDRTKLLAFAVLLYWAFAVLPWMFLLGIL
jgi:hypothetical protein